MNLTEFKLFIDKYLLNGQVGGVIWYAKKSGVDVHFHSLAKNMMGKLHYRENFFELQEDAEIAIYDSAKLKSLINILNNDVTVELAKSVVLNERIFTNIVFSDTAGVQLNFVLSHKSAIPPEPELKVNPEQWEIELYLSDPFIGRYTKALSAIPDSTLTFAPTPDGIRIVIGYSDNNENHIILNEPGLTAYDTILDPVHLPAKIIKDIILANKDAKTRKLYVSPKNKLAMIHIEDDKYNATYYISFVYNN